MQTFKKLITKHFFIAQTIAPKNSSRGLPKSCAHYYYYYY